MGMRFEEPTRVQDRELSPNRGEGKCGNLYMLCWRMMTSVGVGMVDDAVFSLGYSVFEQADIKNNTWKSMSSTKELKKNHA